MGRVVSFAVLGRPVRWQRPKVVVRHGRQFTINEKEHEAAKKHIAMLARLAWKGPPVTGPVILRVDCIFAIPSSWPKAVGQAAREGRVPYIQDPDYDQLVKMVMDALVAIVFVDDNQVVSTPGGKRYGTPTRTEITIHVLDQQPDEITPAQRSVEKRAVEQGLIPVNHPSRLAPPQLFPPNAETNRGR